MSQSSHLQSFGSCTPCHFETVLPSIQGWTLAEENQRFINIYPWVCVLFLLDLPVVSHLALGDYNSSWIWSQSLSSRRCSSEKWLLGSALPNYIFYQWSFGRTIADEDICVLGVVFIFFLNETGYEWARESSETCPRQSCVCTDVTPVILGAGVT